MSDKLYDQKHEESDLELSDEDLTTTNIEEEEDDEELSDVNSNIDEEDNCIYKLTKIIKDDDIQDEYDEYSDDDIEIENNKYVNSEDRITKPYLTKYERVRLLADRATQIASGSQPMLKNVNHLDSKIIAKLELESKKIPLYIERELPDGRIEKWYVHELLDTNKELIPENKIKVKTLSVNSI
jgi:DNA-directed RNA polymerases I, II, and III subunit RPABC2